MKNSARERERGKKKRWKRKTTNNVQRKVASVTPVHKAKKDGQCDECSSIRKLWWRWTMKKRISNVLEVKLLSQKGTRQRCNTTKSGQGFLKSLEQKVIENSAVLHFDLDLEIWSGRCRTGVGFSDQPAFPFSPSRWLYLQPAPWSTTICPTSRSFLFNFSISRVSRS